MQLEGEDEVDVDQSNNLQLPQKDDDEEDGMDGGGDENDDDDEEEAEENKQIDYYPTKRDRKSVV